MGDASDYADVYHFLRSPEGRESLYKFRKSLLGRQIKGVEFTNNTCGVGIILHFDNGDRLDLQAALNTYELYHLRESHAQVLEREYEWDYRKRKPRQ